MIVMSACLGAQAVDKMIVMRACLGAQAIGEMIVMGAPMRRCA